MCLLRFLIVFSTIPPAPIFLLLENKTATFLRDVSHNQTTAKRNGRRAKTGQTKNIPPDYSKK